LSCCSTCKEKELLVVVKYIVVVPVKKNFGYSVYGCACKEKNLWLASAVPIGAFGFPKIYTLISGLVVPVRKKNLVTCRKMNWCCACKKEIRLFYVWLCL